MTPGYFTLPTSQISRVRARIISGDPWEAWHPAMEVDPADPWGDLCARWKELCLLMGFSSEDLQPRYTFHPEELHFTNPWQGDQSISGWNWWSSCGGWESSENFTKQCLSEMSTAPYQYRYPTNTVWVLSKTGTISPIPADRYAQGLSPTMRLATDPTILTAASLYLSVRSCSGIDFISSACDPDTYRTQRRTVSETDEKLSIRPLPWSLVSTPSPANTLSTAGKPDCSHTTHHSSAKSTPQKQPRSVPVQQHGHLGK
jgi:hypothetical protein